MRIGITGSWKPGNQGIWPLQSDFATFVTACGDLGRALVSTGAQLVVGSERESTADLHIVRTYLSGNWSPGSIRVIYPASHPRPFRELYEKHPRAFVFFPPGEASWRFTRQQFISNVDVVLTIGGGDGTYQVGLELALARKRLIPVGSFGGASERLLGDLLSTKKVRASTLFARLNNPWHRDLASHAVDLAGANEPSRVLLIHGHALDREDLHRWLSEQQLAQPVVLVQEFTAGQTIPEKFESLAAEADAAIALATPDDMASTFNTRDVQRMRARQNVWVEVGWFWGRLGRDRVMLLVRGDVEVPSDLDGIVYSKYLQSPIEREDEIRKFLLGVSRENQ